MNPLSRLIRITAATFSVLLLSASARAQVSVTASSGTAGPTTYTTVKGAFDAINSGTHQGAVVITVSSSTTETATAALNASGSGSASYTSVRLVPAGNTSPVVSGNLSGVPVILLNGASNVTIDGSSNGSNGRNLTITNTTTSTPQVVVIGSVGSNAVTNDTLRNCAIVNGGQTSTAVIVSDAGSPGTGGYFNNIAIVNNSIQNAYIGAYLITSATSGNGSGTYVAKNSLNGSGSSAIRRIGIYAQGLDGAVIDSNTIGNFEGANGETDCGIWLATGTVNTSLTGNAITNLTYTGTSGYAPVGINVSPAVTGSGLTLTGNTVTSISTAGSGTVAGIYLYSAVSGVLINRNMVSDIKNTNTGGWGAAGILLASSNTSAGINVYNNFVWDIAAYGTNGWASSDNGNGIVADDGGGYNIYFNTVWMNTNETAVTGVRSAAVLISSNITGNNSINLRNNLLVNTQTVGNANSRMAMVITASTGVLNTCNYNDYYSTSGNLVGQGTNATIWKTIANVRTNIGLNANSVSIQPTFTSSTDLHLPDAPNASLNNLGLTIATITTDIDGDLRTPTPDIGADEFGNCPTIVYTSQPAASAICPGSNASFTSATSNGTILQWQVNAGSGFVNVANGGVYSGATTGTLSIAGATAGMNGYQYRLTAAYSIYCRPTPGNAATLTVNPQPSVNVTAASSTSFCAGGSVTLSVPGGSNLTAQWKNGSGPITGATGFSYTASTTNNYTVTVTNTSTGCVATSTPVAVNATSGPVAAITPAGTNYICQGKSIVLSAGNTPGVTYQWSIGGSPISGATSSTYATNSAGAYTVDVSTGAGCSNTSAASTVGVNSLPTATATPASGNSFCQGTTTSINANTGIYLTYQWLNGVNAPISGETGSSFTTGTAGSYRVIVINSSTTCRDTSSPVSLVMNPLPTSTVTPTAPAAICERDTSVLSANLATGFSYQWQFGGIPINGANNSTYKAFASGAYAVTVTDGNGCKKTSAPVSLTVHPAPVASITYSSPLQFCDGSAVVFSAYPSPNGTYQWYKDGTALTGETGTNYVVSQTGSYTILVTDNFSCTSTSLAVPVLVHAKPVPVVTSNNGMLSAGTYASYQWYFNNVAIGSSGNLPTYTPTENGAYKVTVEDVNGCTGTSDLYFFMSLGTGGPGALSAQVASYPNPATDGINVTASGNVKLKSLSLMNAVGSIVTTREVSGVKAQLPLSGIAAGLYYLRIETDGGVLLRKVDVLR